MDQICWLFLIEYLSSFPILFLRVFRLLRPDKIFLCSSFPIFFSLYFVVNIFQKWSFFYFDFWSKTSGSSSCNFFFISFKVANIVLKLSLINLFALLFTLRQSARDVLFIYVLSPKESLYVCKKSGILLNIFYDVTLISGLLYCAFLGRYSSMKMRSYGFFICFYFSAKVLQIYYLTSKKCFCFSSNILLI